MLIPRQEREFSVTQTPAFGNMQSFVAQHVAHEVITTLYTCFYITQKHVYSSMGQ